MENQNQQALLEEALCYLSYAEAELCRPQEDVVTYCACHFTRKSVTDLLRAFLVIKNKKPAEEATMEELYTQCLHLEPKFEAADISIFDCMGKCDKPGDEKYCLDVNHVNKCYTKAFQIKELVLSNTQLRAALTTKQVH